MYDALDTLERFDFGGRSQWARVRGRSATSPVLLLVQAGPGFPMIQEADALERDLHLEELFRVVYWDQRGTGKSFDPSPAGKVPLETHVEDIRRMVRALCERFHVSEVDVIGFSLGASLALLACAEGRPPVRSLTCVCPDVNLLESETFALDFARAEAERRAHRRAARALRAIGAPPHDDTRRFMERVRWVSEFGGIHRKKTYFGIVRETLARLWSSPDYSLFEMFRALQGIGVTQERLLPALQGFDLLARPLGADVPTMIVQGRFDAAAVPALAPKLADKVGASLVWFEESAHCPHQEEPERFREQFLRFAAVRTPGARRRGPFPTTATA
ncbi:MAG TPA: alpha/beta hydrolase [Polyangiaceae bacterium]|jgi:pimeloyl-ACP methyl ester carboxylesterase|nr:alpha/beta hydrolase [Polyangiaceae bacterium]